MTNKNNYILIAQDKITIDEKIKKIISDVKVKDLEIIKYDYPDISISFVLDELNTYNFLSNCKMVIYNNCTFLNGDSDKELSMLKEYLKNSSDNFLVMVCEELGTKSDIKEICNFVEVLDNKISTEVLIKNNLEDCKMENKTVKYFAEYCLYNNEKVLNELEKIKCYKLSDNDKTISVDDINKMVLKDYDEDVFDLVNSIAKKNKDKAFDIYYRLIQKEKDAVNIIASVSSQIRMLYSVKTLSEDGKKSNEISNLLNVKPYAVSMALENCSNYSSSKLLMLLNSLAEIDYKTKCGKGNSNTLFEMFLLSL